MVSPSQYQSIKQQWRLFADRFKAVDLPEPSMKDFRNIAGFPCSRPSTISGWTLYRLLLEREGSLTEEESANIQQNLVQLETTGLVTNAETQRHYFESGRAETDNFSDRSSRSQAAFSPARQELLPPQDFLKTEIILPSNVLTVAMSQLEFVRYHLVYGLIWGDIEKSRYYDRGAGRFPGSSGAMVTSFRPIVRPLTDAINLRKLHLFKTVGQYRVLDKPPVIIGRKQLPRAYLQKFFPGKQFWTLGDARQFLSGEITSAFGEETLSVEVTNSSEQLVLRFQARPRDLLNCGNLLAR